MRILLVDDEPDIIEFQKSFLVRRKHEVLTAFNTPDAISAIRASVPDIVFCDICIDSERAGFEILKQAREINSNIAFYLVTGLIEKNYRARGFFSGQEKC